MLPILNNGISTLVACQDDEITLRDCVESLLDFSDEIIIVSNRATQETNSCGKNLADHYTKVQFHQTNLPDLPHNRAFALSLAKYRWVFRCDSDYIAYEDCDLDRSIMKLRKSVLSTYPIYPTCFYLRKIHLSMGWNSMYLPKDRNNPELAFIPEVDYKQDEARIYLNTPLLRFKRIKQREGVLGIHFYRKIKANETHVVEVTIRNNISLLLRKGRTEWRLVNDFGRFPTIEDYVKQVLLPRDYPNMKIDEAAQYYVENEVMPLISKYDSKRFGVLPSRNTKKTTINFGLLYFIKNK